MHPLNKTPHLHRLHLDPHMLPWRIRPLRLAFPQDRIRRPRPPRRRSALGSRRRSVLGDLRIAAGVVHTVADLDGVLPDPVLHFLGPRRLELLLADRARRVAQRGVIGRVDPLLRQALLRGAAVGERGALARCVCVRQALLVDCFAGFDPVLGLLGSATAIWFGWMGGGRYVPVRRRTSCGFGRVLRRRPCAGWCGSASPDGALSVLCLPLWRRIGGRMFRSGWSARRRGWR